MKKSLLFFASLVMLFNVQAQENTSTPASAGNAGTYNVSIGASAGDVVTGSYNSFLGSEAGKNTTSGNYNTMLGSHSGFKNTTGGNNTFTGKYSGYNTINGGYNSFYGVSAGYSNTSGTNNCFFGAHSGYYANGSQNVFMGTSAGQNCSGHNNVLIGTDAALVLNGSENVFIGGSDIGEDFTSGNRNVVIGASAGYGANGNNAILIGPGAGSYQNVTDKLFIENSNSSTPLIYGDFATDKVTINGSLGVGAATDVKFKVYESTTLGSTIGNNLRFTTFGGNVNGSAFLNSKWLVRDANGSNWTTARLHDGISIDASFYTPGTDTRTWWERDPYNDIQSWGNNNQSYLTINTGNVGIGTTTPFAKLSVFDSNKGLEFNPYWAAGNGSVIEAIDRTSNGQMDMNFYIQNSLSSIKFYTGAAERLRITSSGNVLIGKTTQTTSGATKYKLDVEGSIRANEIVVNSDGADFVFAPTYKLRPLSEVESFIKQNLHLPEIAPAAEMQKEGVNVSELQTKLLQKVEELTLYTIEQDKKLKAQDAINQQLLNEINELKKLIKK